MSVVDLSKNLSNFSSLLNSAWLAKISLFVGIIVVSSSGLLIKLSETEITPFAVAFNRLWIAALAFLLWDLIDSPRNLDTDSQKYVQKVPSYSNIIMLVIAGVIRGTVLIIWGYALLYTNVTNFTLLHNLEPLFIPLFLGLFLTQGFDNKFWLGWVLTMLGLAGIFFDDFRLISENILGDFLALFASFITTLYYIIKEKLVVEISVNTILKYVCLIGALILLPITLITSPTIFPDSFHGWIWIISLGVLCQFIGHSLITYSLKNVSSALVTLCLPLEVVFASLLSQVFLLEKVSFLVYLSCLIVLVGVCIATLSSSTIKTSVEEKIESV